MADAAMEAPTRLVQLLTGRFVSQAVMVAARLGIADAIGNGESHTVALARRCEAHPEALERLLGMLAAFGVLDATEQGGWKLTPVGQCLRSGVPGSVRDLAIFFGAPEHYAAWGGLEQAVRTGESAFRHVHATDTWSYFREHPDFARSFDRAMTGFARNFQAAMLQSYDFSGFSTLVDVGGGQGGLLCAILAHAPGLRGILFDRPDVVRGAHKLIAEAGMTQRCQVVGGDFFEKVPEGGDAYLLTSILHDWDDERAAAILACIRKAMKPDGRVLAGDYVLRPPTEPDPARLIDLEMLVMTEGGRERTEEEFAALFARAGLRLTRIVPTSARHSVIEAVAA